METVIDYDKICKDIDFKFAKYTKSKDLLHDSIRDQIIEQKLLSEHQWGLIIGDDSNLCLHRDAYIEDELYDLINIGRRYIDRIWLDNDHCAYISKDTVFGMVTIYNNNGDSNTIIDIIKQYNMNVDYSSVKYVLETVNTIKVINKLKEL